jgi:hypothetical protein
VRDQAEVLVYLSQFGKVLVDKVEHWGEKQIMHMDIVSLAVLAIHSVLPHHKKREL